MRRAIQRWLAAHAVRVSFGGRSLQFEHRCSHVQSEILKTGKVSGMFLLFIDCVHQLSRQHPQVRGVFFVLPRAC